MTWDPFQREVLAELGLVAYRAQAADAVGIVVDAGRLARLARAAAVEPEWLAAHPEIMVMAAQLQGDAAGKRALWPRLRRLRRGA